MAPSRSKWWSTLPSSSVNEPAIFVEPRTSRHLVDGVDAVDLARFGGSAGIGRWCGTPVVVVITRTAPRFRRAVGADQPVTHVVLERAGSGSLSRSPAWLLRVLEARCCPGTSRFE
jgi:hypothetical protein